MQVISFAGELLANAEGLLRDGLHTSEVADGYTRSAAKVPFTPLSLLLPDCMRGVTLCTLSSNHMKP